MAQTTDPFRPTDETSDARRDATTNPNAPEHDNTTGQVVGAGVGGTTGGLTGAAIGTAIGGPLGAAIGAVAGVVVGALSGKAIADANADDETYWRENFSSRDYYQQGETYDLYAGAYRTGRSAADRSPQKSFADVESDIRADYEKTPSAANLSYDRARAAIRDAYDRAARQRLDGASSGATGPAMPPPLPPAAGTSTSAGSMMPPVSSGSMGAAASPANLGNVGGANEDLLARDRSTGREDVLSKPLASGIDPAEPTERLGQVDVRRDATRGEDVSIPTIEDVDPLGSSAASAAPVGRRRAVSPDGLRDPLIENRERLDAGLDADAQHVEGDRSDADDALSADDQLRSNDVLGQEDVVDRLDEADRDRVTGDAVTGNRRRGNNA